MSYQIRVTQKPLSGAVLGAVKGAERDGALEVSQRADTLTITVQDAKGGAVGYAVFGMDEANMLAVYYARSFVPIFGPLMMREFFGVAEVAGVPLRVHLHKLRELQSKAKLFGANMAVEAVDADGILQGVFANVQQV